MTHIDRPTLLGQIGYAQTVPIFWGYTIDEAGAHKCRGDQLVKRGRGRPPLEKPKEAVKVRYDQDVLEAFRESGKGWQARIERVRPAIEPAGATKTPPRRGFFVPGRQEAHRGRGVPY